MFPPVDATNEIEAALLEHLSALAPTVRARFLTRYRRCVIDSRPSLVALYGEDRADAVLFQLASSSARALAERPGDLAVLDASREVDPEWFQAPDRLGYVAYCERFGPTIADVERRVPYLHSLGVTYFHLMQVIAARPEPNDGGFAVVDYRDVEPSLGTLDDLASLTAALRAVDISLCVDVVMNHTAREHAWAEAARAGDAEKLAYYITYPDRTEPDDWEATLPEVFPEIAPGNFTWDDDLQRWVWTTFNTYQWDLDYSNPAVLGEMLDIVLFLANAGVEVMRLDAVAFTWKRKGTNCQNQPEAHLIAQILRQFTNLAAPGVLLKAEAIVAPTDLLGYLGQHGEQGERAECHLAYHNQLMVLIWSALASRDARLLRSSMAALPSTPDSAGWATYVRCHDDIGWAIDDTNADRAGIDGTSHRKFLADFYRGDFPGSFAEGASFSVNEETGDERTCGSTASLAGLERALATGDDDAVTAAIERIVLAYGLAASFGMPLLYMGDELGTLNDPSYLDDPDLADDSRWMQRPFMDWDAVDRSNEAGTIEQRIRSELQHLFAVKAATPALAQGGSTWILDTGDDRVFGFGRYHRRNGRLVGLVNVSDDWLSVDRSLLAEAGFRVEPRETLRQPRVGFDTDRVHLGPRSLAWFTDDLADRVVPSVASHPW
ncbi:MAG: alpha-amylase family protein [Acidimicrobiales bacterium]